MSDNLRKLQEITSQICWMLATGPDANYRSCEWFIPREKLRNENNQDRWTFFNFNAHFECSPGTNGHLSAVRAFRRSFFSLWKIKQLTFVPWTIRFDRQQLSYWMKHCHFLRVTISPLILRFKHYFNADWTKIVT